MAFGTFQVLNPEDIAVRHNRKVDPVAILDPTAANALEQGEWLRPKDAVKKTLERHDAADAGPKLAYPVASPKGSTDCQALGRSEMYLVWDHALTTCYDGTASYDEGTPLKVNQVAIGGQNYSVLVPADTDKDNVVAIVENPPDTPTEYTPMRITSAKFTLSIA